MLKKQQQKKNRLNRLKLMSYEGVKNCDWLKIKRHNPVSDHVTEIVYVIWLRANHHQALAIFPGVQSILFSAVCIYFHHNIKTMEGVKK